MTERRRLHILLSHDRRGVTATEYGIIISALAFTLVVIFTRLSVPIASIFTSLGSSI
jgi:Flp pilus assembly pilin Flp